MEVDLLILLQLSEQTLSECFASLVGVGVSQSKENMLLLRELVLKYDLYFLRAVVVSGNYGGGNPLVLLH